MGSGGAPFGPQRRRSGRNPASLVTKPQPRPGPADGRSQGRVGGDQPRAATAAGTGVSPATRSSCWPTVFGVVHDGGDDGGDVGARDVAALHRRREGHGSGGGVVGEAAGPDDRPVEVAVAQRGVGVALGLHVGPPHLAGVVGQRLVDTDRRDLHEPADARDAGALDRLQRALQVDGALAFEVAVGAAAGGEDHGAAALEGGGEVLGGGRLDVEQADLSAAALQLLAVVGVAHQRDRLVCGAAQIGEEVLGDLSVAADDGDASHGLDVTSPPQALPAAARPSTPGPTGPPAPRARRGRRARWAGRWRSGRAGGRGRRRPPAGRPRGTRPSP